jgi:succinate dehydrogenase hydrophobic anchor subunit
VTDCDLISSHTPTSAHKELHFDHVAFSARKSDRTKKFYLLRCIAVLSLCLIIGHLCASQMHVNGDIATAVVLMKHCIWNLLYRSNLLAKLRISSVI